MNQHTSRLLHQPEWMGRAVEQRNGRMTMDVLCSVPLLYESYFHDTILVEEDINQLSPWRGQS